MYPDRLALHAVTDRQLLVQDPDRHMLLISCGAALHHAEVALSAEGWHHRVDRPEEPLAVIALDRHESADPYAIRRLEQLQARRTDRRTVSDQPISRQVLDELVAVTEQAGARLHVLTRDQVLELAVLVEQAQKAGAADTERQREITSWVGGDRPDRTGIPDTSLPTELPSTTVAERDFGTAGTFDAGPGHDTAATYAVLYGSGDEPSDWLRCGEALNALWLAATERGAALLPISAPVEQPFTRHALRRLLGDIGFPYLVVRLGTIESAESGPGRTPRLPIDQIVEIRG